MVGLALARGVDFSLLDPSGRDGDLFLLLSVRYQKLKDEQTRAVETGRQTLTMIAPLVANASKGRKDLFDLWDKTLRRLEDDVIGVRRAPEDDKPDPGSFDSMREAYIARFGDPSDPEFLEHDRAVAAWLERGGDVKNEPMPVRRGATVAG